MGKAVTSTAVVKADEKRLAQYGDLMDDAPVRTENIMIPKLLLMQPGSQFVADEKAKAGQIVESLGQTVLCEKGGSLEIIPFKMVETWVRYKMINPTTREFYEQVPLTAENATLPWEHQVDGFTVRNFDTLNYYCVIPEQLAAGEFMPLVVSFKSSNLKAGKTLETYRAKLADFGLPLCFKSFFLSTSQQEKDGNRWYTFSVTEGRKTEDSELDQIRPWMNRVKEAAVVVDDSDLKEDTVGSSRSASATHTKGEIKDGDEY